MLPESEVNSSTTSYKLKQALSCGKRRPQKVATPASIQTLARTLQTHIGPILSKAPRRRRRRVNQRGRVRHAVLPGARAAPVHRSSTPASDAPAAAAWRRRRRARPWP